jgi:hypothetical protein
MEAPALKPPVRLSISHHLRQTAARALALAFAGQAFCDDWTFQSVVETGVKSGDVDARKHRLTNTKLPLKTPIAIGVGSRIEVCNDLFVLRAGGGTTVEFLGERTLNLKNGVILLDPKGEKQEMTVKTERAEFKIGGQSCSLVETTSNGGAKVICLSGKSAVSTVAATTRSLLPGNLLFCLPDKKSFGPQLDIDLRLLQRTSLLINGFPTPSIRSKEIRAAAFYQAHKVRSKSNAIVGDAKSDNQYDVIFVK